MNLLRKAWDSVALFWQGWKTHLAGLAILVVNGWDAIAPSIDMTQIIADPRWRAIFNVAMAALIFIFRQMANTSNALITSSSEKTEG